jgi:hypothetical protein
MEEDILNISSYSTNEYCYTLHITQRGGRGGILNISPYSTNKYFPILLLKSSFYKSCCSFFQNLPTVDSMPLIRIFFTRHRATALHRWAISDSPLSDIEMFEQGLKRKCIFPFHENAKIIKKRPIMLKMFNFRKNLIYITKNAKFR